MTTDQLTSELVKLKERIMGFQIPTTSGPAFDLEKIDWAKLITLIPTLLASLMAKHNQGIKSGRVGLVDVIINSTDAPVAEWNKARAELNAVPASLK